MYSFIVCTGKFASPKKHAYQTQLGVNKLIRTRILAKSTRSGSRTFGRPSEPTNFHGWNDKNRITKAMKIRGHVPTTLIELPGLAVQV